MANILETKQCDDDEEKKVSKAMFSKNDKIMLSAEILEINNDNNTYKIKLEPNGASNEPAKTIEIDQIYLSKLIMNDMNNTKHKPNKPNMVTSFFSDNDINCETVINRWNKLMNNTNNIQLNNDNDSIDPSTTMEIESSQECDAWFLRECPQTQRLCFILQVYKLWIEIKTNQETRINTFESISDLLLSLKGYSYKQLLNDFHHLKSYHINITQKDSTDDIYAYFKKNCTESNHCNDRNCRSFSRNTRDREKCKDATYRRKLYFIPDRRANNNNNKYKNNNNNDDDDVNEAEIEECNVQDLLDTIHSSLIHYDFNDMTLSNKFVTHFEQKSVDIANDDNDDNDDDKQKEERKREHSGEYGFGIAFKYTEKSSSSSYFCPKKYADLKEELLNNKICKINEFGYKSLYNKAIQFILTWNAKNNFHAKSMGTWNQNYQIRADSMASCQHVLVLMSYTNYDNLQKMFKKTYRKSYGNEHRKDVTLRHSEIANWASLLDQCMTFFSLRLTDDNARFYHGINCQLKFKQFQAFFLCPTSTTTIPQIAYNFASSNGVVIALSKADTRGPVFVNVSFLSDYPKEEERLIMCNNWSFNNIIYNGISTKYYVKCLKLFQKIINGSFIIHDKKLFQIKYQKTLILMMDNYMNNKMNTKIPSYLQTLFNYFVNNINTIWINQEQFKFYIPELQIYLKEEITSKTKTNIFKPKKKNITTMKLGKFSSFLSRKNKNIELQKVSHFKWKIEGQQLESFWRGKQIKGDDIKCDISHLIGNGNNDKNKNKNKNNKKNNNKFIFYPLCKQHTVKDDGRFRYGLKLESYPSYISSFTFRFEFSIPEIMFFDGETMESKGKGAVGDNRFESVKLKKLPFFTIEIIISIRSASLS